MSETVKKFVAEGKVIGLRVSEVFNTREEAEDRVAEIVDANAHLNHIVDLAIREVELPAPNNISLL